MKKLEKAHLDNGISCIRISQDNAVVYSSSFDSVIKAHGLKSATLLKEFKGHSSYISEFHIMEDDNRMISASGDGTLRVWNLKSTI